MSYLLPGAGGSPRVSDGKGQCGDQASVYYGRLGTYSVPPRFRNVLNSQVPP